MTPLSTFGSLALLLAALVFNRFGILMVAGACCVLCAIFADTAILIVPSPQAPLDNSHLPIFDYLVISVLLAGALLPPIAALIVGARNSIIIYLGIIFQPQSSSLQTLLHSGAAPVIAPPIILQIIVAILTFIIMRSLLRTLRRADRAEEIIALKNEVLQLAQTQGQEKQQLEEGIRSIAETHTRIANGDLKARVPLTTGTILWQVAGPLNTLLTRAEQWKQDADLLTKTRAATTQAASTIRNVRAFRQPLRFAHRTGTPLDSVLLEINQWSEQMPKSTDPSSDYSH